MDICYFEDQKQCSNRLLTVMFRGTPCMSQNQQQLLSNYKKTDLFLSFLALYFCNLIV